MKRSRVHGLLVLRQGRKALVMLATKNISRQSKRLFLWREDLYLMTRMSLRYSSVCVYLGMGVIAFAIVQTGVCTAVRGTL